MSYSPEQVFVCTGCDRIAADPDADLAAIQAAGSVTCCPERNVVPRAVHAVPRWHEPGVVAVIKDMRDRADRRERNCSTGADVEDLRYWADQLSATLRQSADSGRVGDEVVERAFQAMDAVIRAEIGSPRNGPLSEPYKALACKGLRAALEAALAAQGQGEAVAWLCEWTDEADGETVRVAFEFKRGAENRAAEVGGDARVIPLFTHPAPAASPAGVPDGEVRLWDTQWMNIVNHDNCYRGWDKADAINHAVKMTEQAIARNVTDGKLPPPRIAAAPSAESDADGEVGKRTNYVSGSVDDTGKFHPTHQDFQEKVTP